MLIWNGIFFLATINIFGAGWTPIGELFAPFLSLYPLGSGSFYPWQLVSYMFLHADLSHIFFNLFALWIFGQALENLWSTRRFIIYYFITGIGAAVLYQFVNMYELSVLKNELLSMGYSPNDLHEYVKAGLFNQNWPTELKLFVRKSLIPTVGASGAVFGILLGFGMMFPDRKIMLLFPPIPIKAKYFVGIYGALELFNGLTRVDSGVAHFAHLGGLLVGFILIKVWKLKKPAE